MEPRQLMAARPFAAHAGPAFSDTTAPEIRSVQVPAPRTYAAGDTLTFRVNFTEPVRVTGSPTLPVEVGFKVGQAELAGRPGRGYARTLTFKLKLAANLSDDGGVTLGTVGLHDGAIARLLEGAGGIVDRAGNAADPALPAALNTSRVRVDAVGPVVQGYGFKNLPAGTVRAGQHIVVEVNFNEPVTVTGRPTVPFSVGGVPLSLTYAGGSGTNALRFAYRATADLDAADVSFREGLGEVIYVPAGASVRDRRGNVAGYVLDPEGNVLTESGNRVMVMGAHYQFIRRVGVGELANVMNVESIEFVNDSGPPEAYTIPTYVQPQYDVNLYKVTYQSVIPEHGNRPTTATGLVAIPVAKGGEGQSGRVPRPMVSYQHGTVYGLKEVPSYSFTLPAGSAAYKDSYETRLAVAQFAGQGYVVIAADYFGMGDSVEPDAYSVKGSEQQATLELVRTSTRLIPVDGIDFIPPLGLLRRSSSLIRAEGVDVTDLLLSGWSQGGLVTMALLERLEEEGVAVTGASTASAPSALLAATTALLLNPRGPSDPVPDAVWINTIFMIASFSYESYYSVPGLAYNFLNPQYYEPARRLYTREYAGLSFDATNGDLLIYRAAGDADPFRVPADLKELIRPEYFDPNAVGTADPRYYPFSRLAALFDASSAYQWVIRTPVQLNYGTNDEAFSPDVARLPYTYQAIINANNPIEPVAVPWGNHRGTFLTAVDNQRYWFNLLLGRNPGPPPAGQTPP